MHNETISINPLSLFNRAKLKFTALDRRITGPELRAAMVIHVLTGCGAMLWYNVCVPGQIFNVFVKNYLGASSAQLGLMVSLMQVATLCQLLAIFIFAKIRTRKVFWGLCHVVHRLYGLLLAAICWYVARGGSHGLAIKIIIGGLLISWVLTSISTPAWWTWQADLFPARIRATFFGRRSAVLNTVSMVWFFTAVIALDTIKAVNVFYIYFFIFLIGGLGGVADVVFHTLIPEPRHKGRQPKVSARDFFAPLRSANFRRLAIGMGLWSFSAGIAGPFFAPYITSRQHIGAPNTWLGIMFVINQLCVISTVSSWGKMMDRFGRKPVLLFCSFSPLVWIGYCFLTPENFYFVLPVLAVLGGIVGAGFGDGSMQLMLSITPEKNRTAFVAWYTTLVGLIGAGGALLGGRLMDMLEKAQWSVAAIMTVNGFHLVVLLSVACCMLSLLVIRGVKEDNSKSVGFLLRNIVHNAHLYRAAKPE
jgi:MFS family permease